MEIKKPRQDKTYILCITQKIHESKGDCSFFTKSNVITKLYLDDEHLEELESYLQEIIKENLGMPVVFTLGKFYIR